MNFKAVIIKLSAYIKITRPVNCFITFISIIISGIICADYYFSSVAIVLAAFSGALSAASGNIINDYFDVETDKINRPDRPLVSNVLARRNAISIYIIFSVISLFISYFINPAALLTNVCALTLLFFYSYKFKKVILLGNLIVAFLTGLAFIYGGIAVNNFKSALIPAIFAFLINFIRELVKDMEDIEGDKSAGVFSFPYLYGLKLSKLIITAFSVILIISTFIPFVYNLYRIEYFVIVMAVVNPVLVYSLKSLYKNDEKKNLNKISFMLKLDMLFGVLAIYLGK
jgi:geranylgeranylglycerol-phosphate geranylgeranyltransferase